MSHPPDPPDVLERFQTTLGLVEIIARQLAASTGSRAQLDDLIGYGREGLLVAARRFDPERGVPFRAYANFRVRGAMIDGLRTMAALPRRTYEKLRALEAAQYCSEGAAEDTFAARSDSGAPAEAERALAEHLANMATAMATGLVAERAYDDTGESTALEAEPDPEAQIERAELLQLVRERLEELPPNEAELVRRHYLQGHRFDHVAKELGLSKSWASRLHTRAISRLTEYFRASSAS